MAGSGRKRTFDFVDFGACERPLWRKADIPLFVLWRRDKHPYDVIRVTNVCPATPPILLNDLNIVSKRNVPGDFLADAA